jgi:hypothetical protein
MAKTVDDIISEKSKEDLENDSPPASELTEEIVDKVILRLKEWNTHNGLLGIAYDCGVSLKQLEDIRKKMDDKIKLER